MSTIQRLKVNVKRFKVNVQRFKVTHAAWGQNLSASVHFHHVAGISINYRRGENSMNVEILNRNNTTISTNSSSSCFDSNSSALWPLLENPKRPHQKNDNFFFAPCAVPEEAPRNVFLLWQSSFWDASLCFCASVNLTPSIILDCPHELQIIPSLLTSQKTYIC